ncbi:MAG TPA: acetate uptake transporter [Candidatus Angelobacter sp.]|jgi:succinate-acetate transporter protein|nr:acetate uptake transporter [Candidatus Angelobacter sp.]
MSNAVTSIRQGMRELEVESQPHAGIWLQPVAAPSVLGLYGFAGATFMVATHMAHWFGSSQTSMVLWPFAAFFGGLAQFMAGMWAYKARDAVATAMHGMWGSFWMAFGILWVLVADGKVVIPPHGAAFPALGFWFIVLAAITWAGTFAASAESSVITAVLGFLAAGSTINAIAELAGIEGLRILAGWLFIISAVIAWYAATALMVNSAFGRTVLRMGTRRMGEPKMQVGLGEPGVLRGQ